MADNRDALRAAAAAWNEAGAAVIAVANDGTKAPRPTKWGAYRDRGTTTADTIDLIEQHDSDGIGVITGTPSGNLEMLELEKAALAAGLGQQLGDLLRDHDLGPLWARITTGYSETSGGGGVHYFYRVTGAARGNTKLARRPATPNEIERNADEKVVTLIETRGEGGFAIVAPSAGRTHPSGGGWTAILGDPRNIATITSDERDAIYAIATMLDAMPARQETAPITGILAGVEAGTNPPPSGTRPGDDYNNKATWDDLLPAYGWTRARRLGKGYAWTRPGKSIRDGISATTGQSDDGVDRLYVFSSSTEFETETPYSKFAAYCVLAHGGDMKAAARQLAKDGYGEQKPRLAIVDTPGAPVATPAIIDPDTTTDTSTRPELDVGNAACMADWLRDNVGTGPLAGMFGRGPDIVHTPQEGEDGYIPLTDQANNSDGPAQVRVIKKSTLASRVQYAYDCYKHVKRDGEWVRTPAIFPVDAARVATDVPDALHGLRRLNGVVHSPIMRPDGTVLAEPGYDASTGLLYLPDHGCNVPAISDNPSEHEVARAVALIEEMTAGFRFLTPHDRANYYGILLTPILRTIAPPPYKLAGISSPQPGSGKTLLATAARIIHGGVFRAELPEDDAELRKQITAMLTVTTGPVIHFDNVTGTLRSSTLAGLLTSATWGDRPLGSTEWIGTPNDRLWVITGNNLLLGGDLLRRALWVTIDPGVPHPERRTGFAIPDLERWVTERRGDLLHALLTLARAWVVAGRPMAASRSSDSYSTWTDTISGILRNAGLDGVFDHPEAAQQDEGSDDDEWGEFLQAVHDVFGSDEWTVKQILADLDTSTATSGFPSGRIPITVLPTQLHDRALGYAGPQAIARSLGRWLRNRSGRWAGSYTVRSAGIRHARTQYWRIETYKADLKAVPDD